VGALAAQSAGGLSAAGVWWCVVDSVRHRLAPIVEGDGPVHDDKEQKVFDAERTKALAAEGFLVIRVRERVVRDAMEQALAWIVRVGEMRLAKQIAPLELRRMETVPLP
jgi:very-short-patch-repair endonuclease